MSKNPNNEHKKSQNRTKFIRITCLVLAGIMTLGVLSSLFMM